MSFEKKVKIALIKKEWTQKDLAEELGITVSYLRDLMKGNRQSEQRIKQIKEVLKGELEEEGEG
jgi:transcriptional regulator with XRE-family HTH domain